MDRHRPGQIIRLFFIGKRFKDIRPKATLEKVLGRPCGEIMTIIAKIAEDLSALGSQRKILIINEWRESCRQKRALLVKQSRRAPDQSSIPVRVNTDQTLADSER